MSIVRRPGPPSLENVRQDMKILVIGATGTIGKAVADALAARHQVVRASRKSEVRVDIHDAASIAALFETVGDVDAVVNCAGEVAGVFAPLDQIGDAQFQIGIRWMMGQINVARMAMKHVRDGGSITVTTGALATHPRQGSAAATMAGAGLEGFVRAAGLEMPRALRINGVSPGWVKERMEQRGMDSSVGMPANALAGYYVSAVEGTLSGHIISSG
jgi:NAD(P)-dependent dehydrogenase (short-subunit alcohol dehydrogenase family)